MTWTAAIFVVPSVETQECLWLPLAYNICLGNTVQKEKPNGNQTILESARDVLAPTYDRNLQCCPPKHLPQ